MADGTTIQIQVQSNADKAAQSLERLAASLEKVKSAVSGGLRLRGLATQLGHLSDAVTNSVSEDAISRIERLANALQQLQSIGAIRLRVPRNVERVAETVAAVQQPREATTVPTEQTTEAVSNTSRLQSLMESLRTIAGSAGRGLGALGNALGYLGGVAGRAVSELRPLVQAVGSLGRTALKAASAGIRGIASGIQKTAKVFTSLRDRIKQSHQGMSQLFSSIKRIAMYRLLRSAIKAITDGLKTGVNNLYQYSKAMGTQFAKSMDSGSSASLKFKNSIAAMLSPAIQAAIPLLVALANAAIAAANAIQQVFAVLTGGGIWYRATNAVNEYADAVGGAGGATKNLLADWDELNVIQSQGGGGGGATGTAFEDMFSIEKIEENQWTNLAAKIKEAIDRGDWYGVGQVIANRVNELVAKLNPEEWAKKLNEFLKKGLSAAVGLLENTDFAALGAKIGAFFLGIFGDGNTINWELIGQFLRLRITAAINTLGGLFSTPGLFEGIGNSFATLVNSFFDFDVMSIAKTIADGVNGAIVAARLFIKKVNFQSIATKIKSLLVEVFKGGENGIDWAAIGAALKEGLTNILSSLSGLFTSDGENSGILTSIAGAAAKMVTGFFTFDEDQKKTVTDAINNFIKDAIGGVERFFTDTDWDKIGEDVAYWIENIDWEGIAERLWTAIGKIFEAASTLGDYIVMGIINSIGNAWNKMGISDILGKIDVFGDVDAFRQWFNTGNTNGLVMNDEGKWISQTKQTEQYIDKMTESAKAAGKGIEQVNMAIAAGITDFSTTAVDATDTVVENASKAFDQIAEDLEGYDVITSADAPSIPIPVNIEPIAEIDPQLVQELNTSLYNALFNSGLIKQTADYDADDYWEQVLGPIVNDVVAASGLVGEAADQVANDFYLQWRQSAVGEDWATSVDDMMASLAVAINEAIPPDLQGIDTDPLTSSLSSAADSAEASAKRIADAIYSINNLYIGIGGGLGIGPNAIRPIAHFATGGYPTTGSMFIANEAGPEYVGTMGGRTAVANSDQIVSGVASGVAAGQAEQNSLLRTQNQLLTRMLNKEFTAKAVPGSEWGRFIQQSNTAYERQTGR